jgi:hypothetical protein
MATSVQAYKDFDQFPLVEVVETGGRDMENALPDQFSEQEYGGDPNHVPTMSSLKELIRNGQLSVRRHIDLKKGTILSDGFAAPAGHAERSAWEGAIATTIAPQANYDLSTNPCWQAKSCQNVGNCTCRLLNGNTDNMLAAFVKVARNWSKGQMNRAISSSDSNEWIRLGRLVFDWTCAAPVLRA